MSKDLSIIIKAMLDQKQVNDPKDIQAQVDKLSEKLKLGLKFDLSGFQQLNKEAEKSAENVKKVTKKALKEALKGDMYQDVQKKLNQIMRDVEIKNGNIQKILVNQDAKTGEITKATLQYSDAVGKVVTEVYNLERRFKKVKDEAGNVKEVLSKVDLKHTSTNAENNIGKQQKSYYDEVIRRLGIIESLKVKYEKLDNKNSDAGKEYTKQIKEHERIIKQITDYQIKLSKEERVSSLNQEQIARIAEKRLEIEKKLAQVKAEQNSKTPKSSSPGKTYVDENYAFIKALEKEKLKIETGRSGIKNQQNINEIIKLYDQEINKINQVTQAQRSLTHQEELALERQKLLIKNKIDEYKKLDSKSTLSSSGASQITAQDIEFFQKEARRKIQSVQNQFGHLVNRDEVKKLTDDINKLSHATPNAAQKMKDLNQNIRQLGTNAGGESRKFLNILIHDIEKIAEWSIGGGIFFGLQNAVQVMLDTIVQIDTQMTELKRVMNEDTDFNRMLTESIQLANELGQSVQSVNESMIGFARQGYDERQVVDLSRTAIIAQNVSELSAEEAMNDITAAMTNFNIKASESLTIVDKLNEVMTMAS